MKLSPWSWIYETHLRSGRIALTFLGLEVIKVPLKQIDSVGRLSSFKEWFISLFISVGWINRWYWNIVIIKTKGGWYLVTPEKPDEFVSQVLAAKVALELRPPS